MSKLFLFTLPPPSTSPTGTAFTTTSTISNQLLATTTKAAATSTAATKYLRRSRRRRRRRHHHHHHHHHYHHHASHAHAYTHTHMEVALLAGIIAFFVAVGTTADIIGQRAKVSEFKLGSYMTFCTHAHRLPAASFSSSNVTRRRHRAPTRPKLASLETKWKKPKGALLRFEPQDAGREVNEPERKRDADGRVTAYRVSKGGISSTTVR